MAKTPLVLESNPRFCGSMNVTESGELPSDMCDLHETSRIEQHSFRLQAQFMTITIPSFPIQTIMVNGLHLYSPLQCT